MDLELQKDNQSVSSLELKRKCKFDDILNVKKQKLSLVIVHEIRAKLVSKKGLIVLYTI